MTEPLDFRAERNGRTASWERAAPEAALLEPVGWDEWRVLLPDGGDVHLVQLERDHGAFLGACDCKGWEYRDDPESPCAHLCTLRQAEFGHDTDTYGQRVRVLDVDEERAQGSVERALADGGTRRCRR
jgi:hypothetical protein